MSQPRRLIDLSHPITGGMAVYPGDTQPAVAPHTSIPSSDYNTSTLTLGTHTGTHLDAPYHFLNDGKRIEQMELEPFWGDAVLVDLAPGSALEPGTPITTETFAAHADVFQPGARIVYRTGWGRQFGGEQFYSNFPTLTPEAAEWITTTGIVLLGMDVPSPSKDYLPVHLSLLGAGIVVLESLANLDELPERFTLCCFPLKLVGCDGSPVRAVAQVG